MKIEQLKQAWVEAKRNEEDAKVRRLAIEDAILEEAGDLPVKGTTTLDNAIKVSTGVTVSYDQEALMDLYHSGEITEAEFPFEKTFKPVNADLAYLEKNKPELFAKIDACAVTKPRKPSIKIVEK